MALKDLFCADVPLRNYSLTLTHESTVRDISARGGDYTATKLRLNGLMEEACLTDSIPDSSRS